MKVVKHLKASAAGLIVGICMVQGAFAAQSACDAVLWRGSFDSASFWRETDDWRGSVKLNFGAEDEAGETALLVTGVVTTQCVTSWKILSKRIPYAGTTGKYAFSLKLSASQTYWKMVDGGTWVSCVKWLDGKGKLLARHRIPVLFPKRPGYALVTEAVPSGAAFFEVQIGMVAPVLRKGEWMRISDMKVSERPVDAVCRALSPDVRPPRILLADQEPAADAFRSLRIILKDPSGVDWEKTEIAIDGKPAMPLFRRDGDSFVLPRPAAPWTDGLHRITVTAADLRGNSVETVKYFLIGEAPDVPKTALREDGTLLIGGKPFFPIGIYGVNKREFNAYNFDRAVSDLKAAGFNTLQSYHNARNPELLSAVGRHGMKMWIDARKLDADFIERIRFNPDVIAWYLGDDTFDNTTPEQMHERDDYMKALDPSRLTCQADPVWSYSTRSRYSHYAAGSDIFLPEIYPVRGKNRKDDDACVASVIRDMRRIAADNREFGAGRRHAVWPIIQMFCGYKSWSRVPREDELYAMSFAALVHGAKGITYFAYGGAAVPERNLFSLGITSKEEIWRATTNVTLRISSLAPVLLSGDAPQMPAPEILFGPVRDALGEGPSVTVLRKDHEGWSYLLAVNAAASAVTARFSAGAFGRVEALWEKRSILPSKTGTFEDSFAPLGVHIYRFRK